MVVDFGLFCLGVFFSGGPGWKCLGERLRGKVQTSGEVEGTLPCLYKLRYAHVQVQYMCVIQHPRTQQLGQYGSYLRVRFHF